MYVDGKRKREELYLPMLRFVVADDWMDKLGMEAFRAWLKFHTWVDRTDLERGEQERVPMSMKATWEKLGMSKPTFYRKVIRPLWEHGLIDIVEYENTKQKGTKPRNIVVYRCPFNQHEKEVTQLEKVRDYDKDYESVSQEHGKKGGGDKHKKETPAQDEPGKENFTGGVSDILPGGGGNKNFTPGGVSDGPNNVSNSITNVSNHLNINKRKVSSFKFYNWLSRKD